MKSPSATFAALGLAFAALGVPSAQAQDAVFGRQTLHGLAEIRWAGADGERSWVKGGFGKSGIPSGSGGALELSQAVVEWRPRFSFGASAVVSGQWQANARPRFDLDEAYLKLKASPSPLGRLSGRVGYFYPPVSLEHEGPGWTTTDMLSASAIGSWIGEEVKVGGVEATGSRRFADHEISATAGLFGWNDTSGTLLSFRGWALHGVRTGVATRFSLPPMTPFMTPRQAPGTSPAWEIDHRAGYYGRLEWRPPAPVAVQLFHYDNRGDRIGVRAVQWAWQTRFTTLGLTAAPSPTTRLRAQALTGRTWMGFPFPETWVDVGFRSAYLMASQDLGPGAASLRLDGFETRDHSQRKLAAADEHGWSLAAGWRQPVTAWADLFLEAQEIRSRRPARALVGERPQQDETVLQTALRLHF
jgi:hypothetical protein